MVRLKFRPEELEGELAFEVRDVDDADLQRVFVDVRGFAVQQHWRPRCCREPATYVALATGWR